MSFLPLIRFKQTFITFSALYLIVWCSNTLANSINISINYVTVVRDVAPTLSNIFKMPEDSGYSGAKLAVSDSNTTGKFLKQHFELSYSLLQNSSALINHLDDVYSSGQRIFIIDAPLEQLIQVNDWAKNKTVILFNSGNSADKLRKNLCLNSVFHTIPSNAMKSDALAQWLLTRRMNKVLLIKGDKPEDIQLANSFKRSSKRFGIKIIDEKQWNFKTDLRRSAQQEIPLFTQTIKDYDVVYVADKSKDFAEFLPYNTYLPRPVIGSAGMEALAWHGVIEQWGAAQLQRRFIQLTDRYMNEKDFAAYVAVRSIAQSVHELHTASSTQIVEHIKSENFELAAYKGRKLSFRQWNLQLRMPIALVHPQGLVSQSPQPGMIHPVTELDTLGFDIQETQCK